MRGLRSTLVLFAVLVGLGGYIYLKEWNPPSVAEMRASRPRVLAVTPDAIEQVTVRAANNDSTTLTKNGEAWRITSPIDADADLTATTTLARDLANLEVRHVVDENPADLAQYGLEPPRVEVLVKTSGDAPPQRLLFGDKTPAGENLYTKLASERRVVLIAGSFEETFDKTTWELRDRRVLPIDRVGVDSLEITGPGQRVALARQDLDWHLTHPHRTAADLGVVSELIAKLTSAEMQSLAEEGSGPRVNYGLRKPVHTVTLGAGSSRVTLEIGSKASASTTYARVASQPLVFTIETTIVDDLKKPVGEYRRKDVFAFAPHEARRLEVTQGGQTRVYERTDDPARDEPAAWREVAPTTRDIEAAPMDTALSGLSFLRAVTFVDSARVKAGVAQPQLTVLVRYGDGGKEDRVRLTRVDDAAYAARDEWLDTARLDANAYARVLESLNALEK